MNYLFLIPIVMSIAPVAGLVWLYIERRKDKQAEQLAFAEMMRQNHASARRFQLATLAADRPAEPALVDRVCDLVASLES